MDLKTYFQLFWLPAVTSAALIALLRAHDEMSGRALVFLASWFLLSLVAQYVGTGSGAVWITGLVLQTALAVFLLLKQHLSQL